MPTTVDMLRQLSDMAHQEMLTAIAGVTEHQSWAVLPSSGADYLHTDGSIHGITLHVAGAKKMYGSVGFRNTEIRWRDLVEEIEKFEPAWQTATEYLQDAHRYWLETWSDFTEDQLYEERPVFSGKLWPAWKIIQMMIHHDSYHAGQITVIRYAVTESTTPPPSAAEDIRQYCRELPSW